jgi:hypothetical protein
LLPVTFVDHHGGAHPTADGGGAHPTANDGGCARRSWPPLRPAEPLGASTQGAEQGAPTRGAEQGCRPLDPAAAGGGGRGGGQIPPQWAEAEEVTKHTFQAEVELAAELARWRRTSPAWPQPPPPGALDLSRTAPLDGARTRRPRASGLHTPGVGARRHSSDRVATLDWRRSGGRTATMVLCSGGIRRGSSHGVVLG